MRLVRGIGSVAFRVVGLVGSEMDSVALWTGFPWSFEFDTHLTIC